MDGLQELEMHTVLTDSKVESALRAGFLTLSTCSRFSSLSWSWFLSHRAKSLSCVTAPRVSLSWAYSDFTCADRISKGQRDWVWECSCTTVYFLGLFSGCFNFTFFYLVFTLPWTYFSPFRNAGKFMLFFANMREVFSSPPMKEVTLSGLPIFSCHPKV